MRRYEPGKSNIEYSERTAINTRRIWQVISCYSTNCSNWENEKSYPDLQVLVDMSNRFEISLDILLKEDSTMVRAIDKERILGTVKHEKSIIDFFTGVGTGLITSCLFSPNSTIRTVVIFVGLLMIGIGWYKKSRCDKKVI